MKRLVRRVTFLLSAKSRKRNQNATVRIIFVRLNWKKIHVPHLKASKCFHVTF